MSVASNLGGMADPSTGWRKATASLSQFINQRIRVRFVFDTVDASSNNFEGWYLDDVVVRPVLTTGNANVRLSGPPGTGARVAGVGDLNGDGRGDFAVVQSAQSNIGQIYVVYGRATASPLPASGSVVSLADVTLSDGTPMLDFTVQSAGNVDNDRDAQGDELNELLLTGLEKSYLLYGGNLAPTIALQNLSAAAGRTLLVGNLFGIGDVNGDGFDDVGGTVAEGSPQLSEGQNQNYHQVGQIFLGGARGPSLLATPDLVIESAAPYYFQLTGLSTRAATLLRLNLFAGVGDLNGDGAADFVQADRFGGASHVLRGRALTVPLPSPRPALLPVVEYEPTDRKSTRLNSSHGGISRMPSSA